MPAFVVPAYGESWPTTYEMVDAVCVTFIAGYVMKYTVVAATNVLTLVGGTLVDTNVVRVSVSGGTSGAVPTGLAVDTNYYVRDVSGATCKLAATSGGAEIDVTGTGTGTQFIGLASLGGEVPATYKQAMMLLIGHWFENRENVVIGVVSKEIEFSYKSLICGRIVTGKQNAK